MNDDKSISKTINSLTNLNFNEINDCRLQSNKLINDYASIRLMKSHLDQIFRIKVFLFLSIICIIFYENIIVWYWILG